MSTQAILILLASGAVTALALMGLGFFLGAWVHHKGVSVGSGMNPNFVGSPKGEVFSIPDADDAGEFPDEPGENEQHVLGRVNQFMSTFGGGRA